nr:hypothetical protein [Tanacetum cinerariifolium]
MNVAGARENVDSPKAKKVKDSAYHKEKMLLYKQAKKGVPLQAKQYDWIADTDEEIDEQELEANYSYVEKIQENDQNDVECDDERVALTNLKIDEFGHVARECQKPKRVKDATYHMEKMLLCKQEEAGIQLNAEQADWRDDTDDESEDQELEAHYMYIAQLQEVSLDVADS